MRMGTVPPLGAVRVKAQDTAGPVPAGSEASSWHPPRGRPGRWLVPLRDVAGKQGPFRCDWAEMDHCGRLTSYIIKDLSSSFQCPQGWW